jgi:arylsulfatase A-like enzyme
MKPFRLGIVLILLLPAPCPSQAAEDSHAVLITIDGFPARMFWDPKTPIPRIRQLAAAGTVAEGMRISNPTVTWPNHTTLVTGVRAAKHSVLYNGLLLREGPGSPVKVDAKRDKGDLVAVPTLYDVLHQAGLRTAAINWPCTRNSNSLDDDFPDVPDNVLHTSPRLRHELVEQHILPDETDASFRAIGQPARDGVWTRSACYVIGARRPHLLLFHLLNTDGVHHRYGPESPQSYAALGRADAFVGELLDALDATGIRTNTTVFLVADHGFASATNLLQPNVLFRQAGLLKIGPTGQLTKVRAMVVPEGGTGMVYLTDPQTRKNDRKQIMALLNGKEGLADIIGPERYAALGLPLPQNNPRTPDLLLAASDGYAVTGTAQGDGFVAPVTATTNHGYHGCLASNPKMNAVFIASGRGIKPGAKIGLVDNIDVAPTIAHLVGHELSGTDGKVIFEILSSP